MNNIPVIGVVICAAYSLFSVFSGLVASKYVSLYLPIIDHRAFFSISVFLAPVFFLLTDLSIELYGLKFTRFVMITAGALAFSIAPLIEWMIYFPTADWSVIDAQSFSSVFCWYTKGLFAGTIATLASQISYLGVAILMRKLKINKIWVRTGASNIMSQIAFSVAIVFVLVTLKVLPLSKLYTVTADDLLMKGICLMIEIPLFRALFPILEKCDTKWKVHIVSQKDFTTSSGCEASLDSAKNAVS